MERGMLRDGADRVRDRVITATERKQMTRLAPIRGLMQDWLPEVAMHLRDWCKSYAKSRAPKPIALEKLLHADEYVMSLIAIRTILDSITTERTYITGLAVEIGRCCEHEQKIRAWEAKDPDLFYKVQAHLDRTDATSNHRKLVNINRFNHLMQTGELDIEWAKWGPDMQLRVGLQLINIVIQATRWFEIVGDPNHVTGLRNNRPAFRLVVKEGLAEWIGKKLDDLELNSPAYKPTVIPPKPWVDTRTGGYWTPYVRTPRLIRFKANQEEQKDRAADDYEALDMPLVYEAINYLQDVPWRINARVHSVVSEAWRRDLGLGGMPLSNEKERPGAPADIETNEEAKGKWKRSIGEHVRQEIERVAQARTVTRTLGVAFEYSQEEEFYFPHMLDFRGRMYPIPVGLQPQGDDLSRGLLEFADGKPVRVGEDGNGAAGWLAVHLSACWGYDKASYEDRIQWVRDREPLWRRIAADPLGNLEWAASEVDKPWCSLAAIFEWVDFLETGEGFISHLPVSVDGTCNGIQHLSAMTRDEVAGEYVNLVPGPKPRDIYKFVADRVQEKCERIEADGGLNAEHATYWLDLCNRNLPRSLTKRQVMVVPYGGSKDSFFNYTRIWLDEADPMPRGLDWSLESTKEMSALRNKRLSFMVPLMWDEVRAVVSGGIEVMEWLQKCAKATTSGNQPLFWTTPSGFVVRHFYGLQTSKKIETMLDGQRVQLRVLEQTPDLDKASQLRGVSPNFVHSLDASALALSLKAAKERGIVGFTSVHDAYGTHAADMWPLYHILREAFVLVHSENMLAAYRASCENVVVAQMMAERPELDVEKAIELANDVLPALPSLGRLNLGDVLSSDYFFA
ncbi:DNA-directed RNA polymerase [Methylobacterium marchantiae]|uniref:DNA-directed RNA polymerase n=1 Tax=Methylobacterium marchantiae TaxID=600331 RepID=A0ABW3X3X9_9HYPH